MTNGLTANLLRDCSITPLHVAAVAPIRFGVFSKLDHGAEIPLIDLESKLAASGASKSAVGEMSGRPATAICTWFVADSADEATFFPQIGAQSSTPETQAIYWRCVAAYFASSVAVNDGRAHVFFTNAVLPTLDGISFDSLFAELKVEVVRLPITYRLPKGSVSAWGNQFYILDVLTWLAREPRFGRAIILDSDCVWLKSVAAMEAAIDRHGALTYELDHSEHSADEPINGLTRAGMARFLRATGGPTVDVTPYYGGEIVAASHVVIGRIVAEIAPLWAATISGATDAPKEEAHFLSIIYAKLGLDARTGNPFIRRIWTNLTFYNARRSDLDLTIWHLPSAKRFGFAALYRRITVADLTRLQDAAEDLGPELYRRVFGVPHRNVGVILPLLLYKLGEKARMIVRSQRRT